MTVSSIPSMLPSVAVLQTGPQGPTAGTPATVLRQGDKHDLDLSRVASVSADGRFVAFRSRDRLLQADRNEVSDIYVFDRRTGALTLETGGIDGATANGDSSSPGISGEGRFLVFDSSATNLTSESECRSYVNVFLRDRWSKVTRCVGRTGRPGDERGMNLQPAIISDGRIVAFTSSGTGVVDGPDANGTALDVYAMHVPTGRLERVNVTSAGRQVSTGAADSPALSGNGRLVAFVSTAPLDRQPVGEAGEHQPGTRAVYIRDLTPGTTTCISCTVRAPRASGHGVRALGERGRTCGRVHPALG